MTKRHLKTILFLLFAISGFTGLIYESIWSHYLKLFLGHAAYAQALVLAIFMGGMAMGAWLTSRRCAYWKNLLMGYALVEGMIGLLGIIFHPLFELTLDISFNTVIPSLDSPLTIQLYKWTMATTLILPQSILLGMTFPLMSNGILRRFADMPGQSLSMLYFTNSLGAALGVLISGFVLIAATGLPGTILFAGMINILLALSVYVLVRNTTETAIPAEAHSRFSGSSLLLLGAAFITGMASFIYEVAWLRMLSMVLGSSTHSFELMLSAFITGLAFGGLFIRRYIDQIHDPLLVAGIIQIIMGLCALATVPLYNHTFDLMGYLMSALKPTDAGYILYTLSGHFIAFLVMLPATFCAGMTLPLFTRILMARGYGEKSIGQIYASNTLGAIAGVIFAIYIAMPLTGLKNTMAAGSALDVILGFVMLAGSSRLSRTLIQRMATVCIAFFMLALFTVEFDFRRMSSSVYRNGTVHKSGDHQLVFHQDGKTSTVHVTSRPDGLLTISTNGKPDASINMNLNAQTGPDETTMVLLAALPVAIKPDIKTAANIGMGSGLTTHTLLAWPGMKRVDTIEIEPAIVAGAEYFRPRVERTFSDPRSKIYIDDAKTFFSNHKYKYDLIISEPSNPWVSGVSSLFTDEFYRQTEKYLNRNGLFVQWLHTYEIDMNLVFSVLKSIDLNYRRYSLYAANDGDMLIVASNNSNIGVPVTTIFGSSEMKNELSRVHINNLQDITARFIANEQLIRPLLNSIRPVTNSDYFPVLDLNAARARYKQENAYDLTRLRLDPLPLINMLLPEYVDHEKTAISRTAMFSTADAIYKAKNIHDYATNETGRSGDGVYADIELLLRLAESCDGIIQSDLWTDRLFAVAAATVPYLTSAELTELWGRISPDCTETLNEQVQPWLDFIMALGRRDAVTLTDTSLALLEDKSILPAHRKFVFGALLLALVRQGEYDAAIKEWLQRSHELLGNNEIPLSLAILYSMAEEGRMSGNPADALPANP